MAESPSKLMMESNHDLRKQMFKMQVQKNMGQQLNSSFLTIEFQNQPLQDSDGLTKIPLSEQILTLEKQSKSQDNNDTFSEKILQRPRNNTYLKRSETKLQLQQNQQQQSQDNEDENKQTSLKLIKGQSNTHNNNNYQNHQLKRSETMQIQKEIVQPIESTPILPKSKRLIAQKSKMFSFLNAGLLQQFQQPTSYPTEKAEIIKRIRTILSKEIKMRNNQDIDYLQDCYKEKISFFKMVSNRYGITPLRQVFKAMKYEVFERGQKIFQAGDKGDKFYIILSGKAKVAILNSQSNDAEITQKSNFSNTYQHNRTASLNRSSLINSPNQLTQTPDKQKTLTHTSATTANNNYNNNNNTIVISSARQARNSQIFKMFEFSAIPHSSDCKKRSSKQHEQKRNSIFENSVDIPLAQQIEEFQKEIQERYSVLRVLVKGDSFGEMSMKPGKASTRTATVFADEKCEFAVISRYDYMHIIIPLEQQDTKQKIEFLKKIPLFANWEKKDLKMLSYSLHEQEIPKNTFLFKEGDDTSDLYLISCGEFRITKECSSMINEVKDVKQSKSVVMKESLVICLTHVHEFMGEESLLGLKQRSFSVVSNSLDCSVYRVSKYDLENIYQSLSERGQDFYFSLIETLLQKREWRLERFNELHSKHSKEKKLMHSQSIDHFRFNSTTVVSSPRSNISSSGTSPNNIKLQATSSLYQAKINFTSAFQQEGGFYNLSQDEVQEKTSKNRKGTADAAAALLKSAFNSNNTQRSQQSQSSSSSSNSSQSRHSSLSQPSQYTSQQQFIDRMNLGDDYDDNTKSLLNNQEQKRHSKQFDPNQYYERLRQKMKKVNEVRDVSNKFSQKLNHNKILSYDSTPQKNQNAESTDKQDKTKPLNTQLHTNYSFAIPFSQKNYNLQQSLFSVPKQAKNLNISASTPQLHKANSDKMKLNDDDEKALSDYYKLKNVPISVMFSKADEQLSNKISSNTQQMQQRLLMLGIETPSKRLSNITSPERLCIEQNQNNQQKSNFSKMSPNQLKRYSQQISPSPLSQNITSKKVNSAMKYQFSQGRMLVPQNKSACLDSVDQATFMQMIREKNSSQCDIIQNNESQSIKRSRQQHHQQSQGQKDASEQRDESRNKDRLMYQQSKVKELSNVNEKRRSLVNEHKKQKEEYEKYLKERQFIQTMKSYADMYKVVEMNYLEQHSLKAHQLMKDTMDDMNLIHKFSEQTFNKRKAENVQILQRKQYAQKLQQKQKLKQFDKLKKQGIINTEQIDINNSVELINHLNKLAKQKLIYDDKADPTGSKANTYNFGGIKQRRKVGIQLDQMFQIIQQQQTKTPSESLKENILEESDSSITNTQLISQNQIEVNDCLQNNPLKDGNNSNNLNNNTINNNNGSNVNIQMNSRSSSNINIGSNRNIKEIEMNDNVVNNGSETNMKNGRIVNNNAQSNLNSKLIQQKTLDVLAQLQRYHVQSLEAPSQKQLVMNQLRSKFEKSAQLRVFKQLRKTREEEEKTGHIQQIQDMIRHQTQQDIDVQKSRELQNSRDAIKRGCHRKSNTEYFNKLLFGIYPHKTQSRDVKGDCKNAKQSQFYNNNSSLSNISQKPYEHLNKVKQSEFCQFNSQWNSNTKQLQFQRIITYNN